VTGKMTVKTQKVDVTNEASSRRVNVTIRYAA
jgi:hypothetical protein